MNPKKSRKEEFDEAVIDKMIEGYNTREANKPLTCTKCKEPYELLILQNRTTLRLCTKHYVEHRGINY